MREIKFRAWCEDHYVYSNSEQDEYFFEFTDGILKAYWINPEGNAGSVDEPSGPSSEELEPVEQFTGLKDVNDQDVYDSDKIQDVNGDIGTVYWKENIAGFYCKWGDGSDLPLNVGVATNGCKVIGSIHDHLLKGAENE